MERALKSSLTYFNLGGKSFNPSLTHSNNSDNGLDPQPNSFQY